MAKANLGTKRVCPETGRKFYDLEKDPIVSPYTGNEYPLSFFEAETAAPKPDDSKSPEKEDKAATESTEEEELDVVANDDGPEIISLEDADEDADTADSDDDEEIPDIPDMPEVDIEDDEDSSDDNTFLEDDEEDDDLSDVIVSRDDKEEDL